MSLPRSKVAVLMLSAVLSSFLLCACSSSHPNRTHRGDLLDDKVTAQRVQAAFQRAGPDFNQVRAGVTNGTVILTGSVSSPGLQQRAEDIAKSVHRVQKLKDDLQVAKQVSR